MLATASPEPISTEQIQTLAQAIHTDLQEALVALLWEDDTKALTLLQRAARNKQTLWARLAPAITPLARRIGAFDHSGAMLGADDLSQEAFLKYWKTVGRWQPYRGVPLLIWLRRVWRNHFLQLYRRQRRSPRPVEHSTIDRTDPASAAPFSRVDFDDLLATLLPDDPRRDRKREAFRLYWVEGRTLVELTKVFERSETTLFHWIHQVLRAYEAATRR